MKLVDQWRTIEDGLPADWEDVRLVVTTEQPGDLPRAAQVLSPMNAGKVGSTLVVHVRRAGGAQGPDAARRLFQRLDESRTWASLEQGQVLSEQAVAAVASDEAVPLAVSWEAALAPLPADWTDLLGELEVDSSDYLDRAALLCAPLNPTRDRSRLVFRFRCSGRSGYGASRGDGTSLLRAARRRRHHGRHPRGARAVRHGQRRHPGARLARRRKML